MKTEEDGVCMREDVHMEEPFQMPIFYNNKKCSRVCSQCSRVQGKLGMCQSEERKIGDTCLGFLTD